MSGVESNPHPDAAPARGLLPRRRVSTLALALAITLALATAALAGAAGPQATTDPSGDLFPLPDCDAPPGSASPGTPGGAGDITAAQVHDEGSTRVVTVHAGDVDGLIRSATAARVEVWLAARNTGTALRFRRGIQDGDRIDDVVLADGLPSAAAPVPVAAGSDGEAIFRFPIAQLEQLGLLRDSSYGVVVVAGARCDKLGIGRLGLGIRLLLPFDPNASTTTTSAAPTPSTGSGEPTPTSDPGSGDSGGRFPWVLFGSALGILFAAITLALRRCCRGSGGAPPTPPPENNDFGA